MSPVVDIHCHTFNGDDLPVRGYIRRTQFRDSRLGDMIALLADRLVDGAPGYAEEKARLDPMLGGGELDEAFESAPVESATDVDPVGDFERSVDEAVRDLDRRDPGLVRQVGRTVLDAESDGEEALGDWVAAARRAVRWVSMFRAHRLENTLLMIDNFSDAIDLYTPLTVDMEFGLHDRTDTTPKQQVVLQEKISRLSMQGRLPGVARARVHPFIGFDPRRQVRDLITQEEEPALEVVKTAVLRYGFLGVKLYPPMGFRPLGNEATVDMGADVAGRVDDVLRELYDWCQSEDVPITTHCSTGLTAHPSFNDYAAPDNWRRVLDEFPSLRLNLGHCGGDDVGVQGWPWQVARLTTVGHPFLHADVGNHKVYDSTFRDAYVAMLASMFGRAETAGLAPRLMFGSDWYMVAIHPDHDRFLRQYQETVAANFDAGFADSFFGGAALHFLGLDDPTSGAATRLVARYARHAPGREPAWLAGAPTAVGPADLALPGGLR